MRGLVLLAALALCSVQLSGCVAVATVANSFRDLGMTPADRRALFEERSVAFHNFVIWGATTPAARMVHSDARGRLSEKLKKMKKEEKIFEIKNEFVEFDDNAWRADAEVTVRYYRIPMYVVQERQEREIWEYSVTSGWELKAIEPV